MTHIWTSLRLVFQPIFRSRDHLKPDLDDDWFHARMTRHESA